MERCQCLMVHRNCTEYRTTYLDPGRLLCNLPISSVRLTVIRGLGAAVGGYAEETPMVGWMAWMVSDVDGFSWVFVGFGSLVVAWGSWSPDALRNKGKSEMERGSERERESRFSRRGPVTSSPALLHPATIRQIQSPGLASFVHVTNPVVARDFAFLRKYARRRVRKKGTCAMPLRRSPS